LCTPIRSRRIVSLTMIMTLPPGFLPGQVSSLQTSRSPVDVSMDREHDNAEINAKQIAIQLGILVAVVLFIRYKNQGRHEECDWPFLASTALGRNLTSHTIKRKPVVLVGLRLRDSV